jgi:ribosomal protein L16 Arg81 hydroxylase
MSMIIESLVRRASATSFLNEYWSKFPFVESGGCLPYIALGGWDALGSILDAADSADVIVTATGGTTVDRVPSRQTLAEVFRDGYTVGCRHAHRYSVELAQLAEQFQQNFAAPVDIHIYCTPAGHAGFGWHYDAEDVFILQTCGCKQWWLRKNTVNPWPLIETLPSDMRYEREIMPLYRCSLQAGDWLYIPHGYWHRTESPPADPNAPPSISLSIGIETPSGIALFDHLRPMLLDSLRWRERLPLPARYADPEELKAAYRERINELAADLMGMLQSQETLEQLVAARLPDDQTGLAHAAG